MKRSAMLTITGLVFLCFTASAQAQTASAHGSGVATGNACDATGVCPDFGGKGVKFSFNFDGIGPGNFVPVTGTWTATEQDTGVRIELVAGSGIVIRNSHALSVSGTCTITTPTSPTLMGFCFLSAQDRTSNGAVDTINLFASAPNGFLNAFGELASGNINIQ